MHQPCVMSGVNNFNSIKVRLELAAFSMAEAESLVFQFHKGTIRTTASMVVSTVLFHFNSIKVRLELAVAGIGKEKSTISIP